MHTLQQTLITQVEQELGFDTKMLQERSLILFMEKLGYHCEFVQADLNHDYCEGISRFYKFTSDEYSKGNPNFLSFRDAVSLHNGVFCRFVGDWIDVIGPRNKEMLSRGSLKFSVEVLLGDANKARLVQQVKLQRKKGGEVIVQSNFIKLVNVS